MRGKNCSKCKKWKKISEFHRNRTKCDGFASQCKKCVSKRKKLNYKVNEVKRQETKNIFLKKIELREFSYKVMKKNGEISKDAPVGMKTCRRCGQIKTIIEYYHDSKNKDGLKSWCKKCVKIKNQLWKIKNPAKVKKAKRRNYRKHRKRRLYYQKVNREKNYFKIQANQAVQKALRSGELRRLDQCTNPKCRGIGLGVIQSHHWSYERENWPNVIWLCSSCHQRIHKIGKRNKKKFLLLNRRLRKINLKLKNELKILEIKSLEIWLNSAEEVKEITD